MVSRAHGKRLDHWRADARQILYRMHPKAKEAFQRRGPWWTVGRSLFMLEGRKADVPLDYLAFMLNRMDIEQEVPR